MRPRHNPDAEPLERYLTGGPGDFRTVGFAVGMKHVDGVPSGFIRPVAMDPARDGVRP